MYYFLTQSENGDSTDSSPILENLDPSIEQSVPTDSTTPDAFGIWEYIAVFIIIGFRFAYCAYKIRVVLKERKNKKNQDNNGSLSV